MFALQLQCRDLSELVAQASGGFSMSVAVGLAMGALTEMIGGT